MSNAKKKAKEVEPIEVSTGLVIYTDGGCRPSRGVGGWGIHGYTYNRNEESPKNNKKLDAPSTGGYLDSDSIASGLGKSVSPSSYIDGWGSLLPESTNNIAELTAAINGVALARNSIVDAKEVHVLSDSQYVIQGVTSWHKKWEAQNWFKQDGTPVPNADVWQTLLGELRAAEGEGRSFRWSWVKGHANNLGNELADRNATRGVVLGKKDIAISEVTHSDAKGYWNPKNDYNRMFSQPRWYFTTNSEVAGLSKDGRYVYHCGAHGPKNEVLGKRVSDHSFSVLFLKEQEPCLEQVRELQAEISKGMYTDVVIGYLDKILSASTYHEIKEHGNLFLSQMTPERSLFTTDEQLITQECRPARMAFVAVEQLNALEVTLEQFLDGSDTDVAKTDITSYFYEQQDVKGKVQTKLLPTIASSTKSVDVVGQYDTTGAMKTTNVTLTLAIDLPNRNTLSALAERDPKVWLLTRKESDVGFRYYTVIIAGDDVGIWSSVHSNLRIIALES